MKKIVLYTSQTGNTKKVGDAIAEQLGCESLNFRDFEGEIDDYDFIALGFYVDKGEAEAKFMRFLRKIHGKKLGVFMTLGAEPDGEHSRKCLDSFEEGLNANGNEIVREFACQGAIDPNLLETMRKMASSGNSPHPITPERLARWAEAAKHPDEKDLADAKAAFAGIE